mgnify:FL=1
MISFDALCLLNSHFPPGSSPTDEEFQEILSVAHTKYHEQVDAQEAIEALALMQALMAEGEKWVQAAYLVTTPELSAPTLTVIKSRVTKSQADAPQDAEAEAGESSYGQLALTRDRIPKES